MPTNADVLQATVNLIDLFDAREDEMRAWWAGTINGGYNADGSASDGIAPHGGYYPMTNSVGATIYFPCIALLRSVMLKGDTGNNASQDVALDVVGTFGPGEYVGGFIAASATTYNPAGSFAKCKVAPTSQFVVSITKNGTQIGTVTFAAGQLNGVVAMTTTTVASGDLIEFWAPASADPTFTHFILTLRGI